MVAGGNVGAAFALVLAAGFATVIGASVVFCVTMATPKLLAGSLGFAAGVMIYVCFGEILMRNSVDAFLNSELSVAESYRYATLSFFGGMVVIALLDRVVHAITHHSEFITEFASCPLDSFKSMLSWRKVGQDDGDSDLHISRQSASVGGIELHHSSNQASRLGVQTALDPDNGQEEGDRGHQHLLDGAGHRSCNQVLEGMQGGAAEVMEVLKKDPHALELKKMGILTAIAMGIHNFPEGLATFVGALADVKVGASIAVAIAIHNIPEGICVAMPIYYATGNKWKAFLWASVPGMLEPLGGLIGYLALHGSNNLAFAIVFGLVAGMMVYISIKELIPAAFRYDPDDTITSAAIISGMAIMAASLLLFEL